MVSTRRLIHSRTSSSMHEKSFEIGVKIRIDTLGFPDRVFLKKTVVVTGIAKSHISSL